MEYSEECQDFKSAEHFYHPERVALVTTCSELISVLESSDS